MKLTTSQIKQFLAEQIGVEPEDLNDQDSFVEDLHMTNADLTDFSHRLEVEGVDPKEIDFASVETIEELIEALGVQGE